MKNEWFGVRGHVTVRSRMCDGLGLNRTAPSACRPQGEAQNDYSLADSDQENRHVYMMISQEEIKRALICSLFYQVYFHYLWEEQRETACSIRLEPFCDLKSRHQPFVKE